MLLPIKCGQVNAAFQSANVDENRAQWKNNLTEMISYNELFLAFAFSNTVRKVDITDDFSQAGFTISVLVF